MSKLQTIDSALSSIGETKRLQKLKELCAKVNTLIAIGDRLGPDDCDVVREAAEYVEQYRNSMLSWWVMCRLTTGLRDVGVPVKGEDIKAMSAALQEADFDLDHVFSAHLDSDRAIDSAHNLAHVLLRGDTESGMADIQNTAPELPDFQKCEKLLASLDRILARFLKQT